MISSFIKIQIGLILLVLVYPGCPEKEAIKLVYVFLIELPAGAYFVHVL